MHYSMMLQILFKLYFHFLYFIFFLFFYFYLFFFFFQIPIILFQTTIFLKKKNRKFSTIVE